MKINKLRLQTSNLKEQIQFYSTVLGFKIIDKQSDSITFICGQTQLTFIQKEAAIPYHFAFNIPSNQIELALAWLKDRVEIITHEGNEIQDFDFWNAKAVYFYDKDQNIVEFIARRDLNAPSDTPFSIDSVLSVSEIAIVSTNNEKIFDYLLSEFNLTVFLGNKETLTAIGDDKGLFICMDKTKRKWFPTGEEAFCSGFAAEFVEDEVNFHLKYEEEILTR